MLVFAVTLVADAGGGGKAKRFGHADDCGGRRCGWSGQGVSSSSHMFPHVAFLPCLRTHGASHLLKSHNHLAAPDVDLRLAPTAWMRVRRPGASGAISGFALRLLPMCCPAAGPRSTSGARASLKRLRDEPRARRCMPRRARWGAVADGEHYAAMDKVADAAGPSSRAAVWWWRPAPG